MISIEEAILIAYYRGHACSKVNTQGAMLATGCSQQDATKAIEALGFQHHVQVACINSPENVTISGDRAEIHQLKAHLDKTGIFARELRTDGKAYHSNHMTTVGQEYEEMIAATTKSASAATRITSGPQWISSVTGELVNTRIDHTYWRKNLESPVRFADAVKGIAERTSTHFIEVGPHSVLELPIKQNLNVLRIDQRRFVYFSTLSRGVSEVICLLSLMGQLFNNGHDVSFSSINNAGFLAPKSGVHQERGKFIADLPNYKWKHDTSLWNESRYSNEFRNRRYPRHDILGSRIHGTGEAASIWRNLLKVGNVLWLKDHRIDEQIVFPAAGYIAMAIEAACQLIGEEASNLPPCHLQDIIINKAMVLSEEGSDNGIEVYTTLNLVPSLSHEGLQKVWQFSVASCLGDDSNTHAIGVISLDSSRQPMNHKPATHTGRLETQSSRSWYDRLSQVGLYFSGDFRSLTDLNNSKPQGSRLTTAKTPIRCGGGSEAQSAYAIHPSTIDAILHTGLIATAAGALKALRLRIPNFIESIRIHLPVTSSRGDLLSVSATANPTGVETMSASVEARTHNNEVFMQVQNVRLVVPFQNQKLAAPERHPMLRVVWKPDITMMKSQDLGSFLAHENYNALSSFEAMEAADLEEMFLALDLLTHKDPGLRIANLQDLADDSDRRILKFLEFDTAFKRCKSFARASCLDKGLFNIEKVTYSSAGQHSFGASKSAMASSCDLLLQCGVSES